MPGSNDNLSFSLIGLAMLQGFEECRLTAYLDVRGRLTIGWGHCGPEVVPGLTWTAAQATVGLEEDVLWASKVVQEQVKVSLAQHEFDALVSFVFNEGSGHFETSTLLALVNAGDFAGAAAQFGRWIYAGPLISSGLVKRRQIESAMFLGNA